MTRHNHQIAKGPIVPRIGDDIHTAEQAAALPGVNRSTVMRWLDTSLLTRVSGSAAAAVLVGEFV